MPPEATVRGWVVDDIDGFAAQYARARDIGLDVCADELFEIADGNGDVARDRLRFDMRRWYLSKMAPKRYGDKTEVAHTGPGGGPIETREVSNLELARRILFIVGSAIRESEGERGSINGGKHENK